MNRDNETKIKEFLERGVEHVYPSVEALEKALNSGKKLKFYCGFDPSTEFLHIGHAIQMNKLAQLQALGHKVIFLVGDFTGMIGDPTDKKAARKQLTRADVRANSKLWKKQASAWLSFSGTNAAEIKYNSKWYDKMSIEDFIRLASNFTVQQMIVRDMFQERLKEEKPIYLHEFLYPLIQGYDSVAMEVDGEIGGNDQIFNMLAGRDLMKALNGQEKFVIANKLIVDNDGKKMGKTDGNAVNLSETPENMYGQIMSWPDGVLASAFELCTKLSWEEVKKVQERLANTSFNPRDFKMKLAHEITKIYHGEKAADKAEEHFVKIVQKKEAPEEMQEILTNESEMTALAAAELSGTISSKTVGRSLFEQGAIRINGEVKKDPNEKIIITKDGIIFQKGKREFRRIIKK